MLQVLFQLARWLISSPYLPLVSSVPPSWLPADHHGSSKTSAASLVWVRTEVCDPEEADGSSDAESINQLLLPEFEAYTNSTRLRGHLQVSQKL